MRKEHGPDLPGSKHSLSLEEDAQLKRAIERYLKEVSAAPSLTASSAAAGAAAGNSFTIGGNDDHIQQQIWKDLASGKLGGKLMLPEPVTVTPSGRSGQAPVPEDYTIGGNNDHVQQQIWKDLEKSKLGGQVNLDKLLGTEMTGGRYAVADVESLKNVSSVAPGTKVKGPNQLS